MLIFWCNMLICTGPCHIGSRALPDAVPLEKGMILSDGQLFCTLFCKTSDSEKFLFYVTGFRPVTFWTRHTTLYLYCCCRAGLLWRWQVWNTHWKPAVDRWSKHSGLSAAVWYIKVTAKCVFTEIHRVGRGHSGRSISVYIFWHVNSKKDWR